MYTCSAIFHPRYKNIQTFLAHTEKYIKFFIFLQSYS